MGCLFVLVLGGLSAAVLLFPGLPAWALVVLGVLWSAALVVSFFGGHHGFGNGGNTDFLIVVAGFLVSLAVLVPRYAEHTPRGKAKVALRRLAEAEERYYRDHGFYTTSIDCVGVARNPEVYVMIPYADDRYFLAMASHPGYAFDNGELRVVMWNSERGGFVE